MSVKIHIDKGSLNMTMKSLDKKAKQINAAASEGLESVALDILADSQATLKENKNIATGKLINSGKVKKNTDNTIDVEYNANYAKSIEYGQTAGTKVSIKALVEWIKKKGIADTYTNSGRRRARGANFEKSALSIAFAIQKSIKAKGTKARPFLFPAFRKYESKVINIINNAINRVI